jgi:hypothetical protein
MTGKAIDTVVEYRAVQLAEEIRQVDFKTEILNYSLQGLSNIRI